MTAPGSASGRQDRIVNVFQGQCKVSKDQDVVFSTVLGSCISACIYDPVAGVGGMNHFLLPSNQDASGSASMRYGAHSMEVLLNELFKIGATRPNMRVKIAGGAQVASAATDIGSRNEAFVREFLRQEGYQIVSESLGGKTARRVLFRPSNGDAKVRVVHISDVKEVAPEPPPPVKSSISLF